MAEFRLKPLENPDWLHCLIVGVFFQMILGGLFAEL